MVQKLLSVIRREFREIISTRQIIFTTVVGPLLSLIITVAIFYHGAISDVKVAVVDLDNSSASRELLREINSTKAVELTDYYSSSSFAIESVKRGENEGFILIENGFQRDILKNETAYVKSYINSLNVTVASTVENGIYSVVADYAKRMKINNFMKGGMSKFQAEISASPIKVDTHTLYNPFKSFSYFLTVAILPLLLLVFIFMTTLYSLGIELKTGSAKQFIAQTGGTVWSIVGKILPYTVIYTLWGVIYSVVEIEILKVPVTETVTYVIASYFVLVVAYQSMAIFMITVTANLRLSLSLGSAYTMMALTFAGVTFPTIAMNSVATGFGMVFPYFFIVQSVLISTLKNGTCNEFITSLYPVGIYVVIGLISLPMLVRRYHNSKNYYKE